MALLEHAVEIVPGEDEYWLFLGRYRVEAKDCAGALEAFERAAPLAPDQRRDSRQRRRRASLSGRSRARRGRVSPVARARPRAAEGARVPAPARRRARLKRCYTPRTFATALERGSHMASKRCGLIVEVRARSRRCRALWVPRRRAGRDGDAPERNRDLLAERRQRQLRRRRGDRRGHQQQRRLGDLLQRCSRWLQTAVFETVSDVTGAEPAHLPTAARCSSDPAHRREVPDLGYHRAARRLRRRPQQRRQPGDAGNLDGARSDLG